MLLSLIYSVPNQHCSAKYLNNVSVKAVCVYSGTRARPHKLQSFNSNRAEIKAVCLSVCLSVCL